MTELTTAPRDARHNLIKPSSSSNRYGTPLEEIDWHRPSCPGMGLVTVTPGLTGVQVTYEGHLFHVVYIEDLSAWGVMDERGEPAIHDGARFERLAAALGHLEYNRAPLLTQEEE